MPFRSPDRIDCRAAAAGLSGAAVVVLLAIAKPDPALAKVLELSATICILAGVAARRSRR